jgi:hypothetical protein
LQAHGLKSKALLAPLPTPKGLEVSTSATNEHDDKNNKETINKLRIIDNIASSYNPCDH